MKTTIAYLAGIVDGEGYIGIKRQRRKGCTNAMFHERIQVRMTNAAAIRLLTATLGGWYYRERKPQVDGRKRLYLWSASDRMARSILQTLLPYLRIKKRNALVVLKLRKTKICSDALRRGSPTRRTIPRHVIARRERLYFECKRLNGRR